MLAGLLLVSVCWYKAVPGRSRQVKERTRQLTPTFLCAAEAMKGNTLLNTVTRFFGREHSEIVTDQYLCTIREEWMQYAKVAMAAVTFPPAAVACCFCSRPSRQCWLTPGNLRPFSSFAAPNSAVGSSRQ